MLYVSKYDKEQDKYGVTDTDDGTTEFVSSAEAFGIVRDMHIRIHGVDINQMKIGVVNADGTPKATRKVAPKTEGATAPVKATGTKSTGVKKTAGTKKSAGTAKTTGASKAAGAVKKPAAKKAAGATKTGATVKKP